MEPFRVSAEPVAKEQTRGYASNCMKDCLVQANRVPLLRER